MEEKASMANEWAVGALKPTKFPDQSPEFLAKLAKDIATNLVFTSHHIREFDSQNIGMIFMPLMLGALAGTTEQYRASIGMVYEYHDKAGPRSINGYPIFFSCNLLSMSDTKVVWEKVEKIQTILADLEKV